MDVLFRWVLVQQKQNVQNAEAIQGVNIWYNTKILKESKPFLYCQYIKKGIIFIGDLLDDEGNILNLVTFKRKCDMQTNFLNYASLVKAVEVFLSTLNNSNNTLGVVNRPILPFKLQIILNKTTGSKPFFNILYITNSIPTSQIKYVSKGETHNQHTWEKFYYLPFKCVKDTTMLWFQYSLLHRLLIMYTFLHMIHYVGSSKCSLCNNALETYRHLFFVAIK